jgi:beta-galactosidase
MTRKPVRIVSASAGVNSDQVQKSWDDDETTSWSSDGNPENAWIEYRFDRAVPLFEITLKLDEFRRKSYPIRITADGREVFDGDTPKSLGYVTIPLKSVTGRTLRIELKRKSGAGRDAFNITEFSDQQGLKTAGSVQSEAGGSLGILEAEIYGFDE